MQLRNNLAVSVFESYVIKISKDFTPSRKFFTLFLTSLDVAFDIAR